MPVHLLYGANGSADAANIGKLRSCKRLYGFKLLPYSALLGAFVFLLADTLGRSIAYPYEISAAIIMAIVGGPTLVVLLRRSGAVYGK